MLTSLTSQTAFSSFILGHPNIKEEKAVWLTRLHIDYFNKMGGCQIIYV